MIAGMTAADGIDMWKCEKCKLWSSRGWKRQEGTEHIFVCTLCTQDEDRQLMEINTDETKKTLELELEPVDILILETALSRQEMHCSDLFVKVTPTLSTMVRPARVGTLRCKIEDLARELRAGGTIDVPSRY